MLKNYNIPNKERNIRSSWKTIIWAMSFLLIISKTFAQDLEQIGKSSAFKVSGGINANQVFYYSDGSGSRREPYNYFLSGRIAFSYAGITLPLSFSFSNQRFSYGQPFNIVGLSPKYKWVTGHFGYRSMSFSPYTLNGHTFLGAGIELEPKRGWRSAAMYGRLLKAVELQGNNRPSYERWGYGFKTEYTGETATIGISMFTAKDYANSLQRQLDTIQVTPQQNVAIGINIIKKIRHISFALDLARSAVTRDVRTPLSNEKSNGLEFIFAIPKRTTTDYFNAIKANATYQFKGFNVGAGFERIDPGYRTLGAYFFNNDLQSYTANFSTSLWRSKISLASNVGYQHDNLDNKKSNQMKRWVTAINLSFVPGIKWNFSLNYSNFQSVTNIRPQIRPLSVYTNYDIDTLNFVLISQSATASAMYAIKATENVSSSIMITGSSQFSSQKNSQQTNYTPAFYNGSLSYGHSWNKLKLNTSLGLNTNVSGRNDQRTIFIGPTFGIGKALFKNMLQANLNGSWSNVIVNGGSVSRVLSIAQSNGITIAKKHNLNATFTYLNMAQPSKGDVSGYSQEINEVTATIGYGYSF